MSVLEKVNFFMDDPAVLSAVLMLKTALYA